MRIRGVAALAVAALALTALVSVLPTPLANLLRGVFGTGGVIGPVTVTTAVVFWSAGLLVIARGLRAGHRMAWALTLAFAAVATTGHVLRHDDLIETVLLGVGAALLLVMRRAFPVRISIRSVAATLAAVGLGLGLGAAAGLVRDQDRAQGLATTPTPLSFGGGLGPTFLLVLGLALVVVVLSRSLSPRKVQDLPEAGRHLDRERARLIVEAHGRGTLDYFALRDDKRWFFHAGSVVAYAVRYGVCLVSPDPIGPDDERRAVWGAFSAHAREQGWSISVLGAGEDWITTYRSFGLRSVYMGDEAIVDCSTFTLEGRVMRSLRQACNRVDRAGYTVSFHDPVELDEAERAEILALASLSREGEVERGFSMTLSRLFDADDTGLMLSVARDEEGRARAFVQWAPAPGINGWSLDVMRYDTGPDVPNGLMDHLIVRTIQRLAARGEVGLGLNFAVVRHFVTAEPATAAGHLGQRLLHTASGRTQISSLCRYNEKFTPSWQPRYVILDRVDTIARQGLVIATAEGLSELPLIGRFMTGVGR